MTKKLAIAVFCTVFFCTLMHSQSYVPRESWPFLYEDFVYGTASAGSDDKTSESYYNISATDGTLYYLNKDNQMMIADMARVNSVRIESDIYINIAGKMYLMIVANSKGLLVKENIMDKDEASKVNIGYGVSSASASYDKVGLIMEGRMSSFNKSFVLSKAERQEGAELPMKETIYMYFDGNLVPASRAAVFNLPGVDKDAAKAFIKKEKIRWKDTESLKKLMIWLNDNI